MSEGEIVSQRWPAGKLICQTPILNAPWTDISVDFITGLPEAQGYDAILVVCDRFTKQVHNYSYYEGDKFSRGWRTSIEITYGNYMDYLIG